MPIVVGVFFGSITVLYKSGKTLELNKLVSLNKYPIIIKLKIITAKLISKIGLSLKIPVTILRNPNIINDRKTAKFRTNKLEKALDRLKYFLTASIDLIMFENAGFVIN